MAGIVCCIVLSPRLRAGVGVGQILPTSARTLTPGKTVDSDGLQLRSQLRLTENDTSRAPCHLKVVRNILRLLEISGRVCLCLMFSNRLDKLWFLKDFTKHRRISLGRIRTQ